MPVIIQSGWTKGRGRYAQPQRHHGASQSQFAGRISAIFGADSFARVQGYGGCQTTTGHRTSPFGIADVSSLVGVFAGALSAIGVRPRLFNSFGPYQVARHLLSRLLNSSQEPSCRVTNRFDSFSCVVSHAVKEQHGANRWNEKAFPNTTKVLMRVA